jgi:hypothetical protein
MELNTAARRYRDLVLAWERSGQPRTESLAVSAWLGVRMLIAD